MHATTDAAYIPPPSPQHRHPTLLCKQLTFLWGDPVAPRLLEGKYLKMGGTKLWDRGTDTTHIPNMKITPSTLNLPLAPPLKTNPACRVP